MTRLVLARHVLPASRCFYLREVDGKVSQHPFDRVRSCGVEEGAEPGSDAGH